MKIWKSFNDVIKNNYTFTKVRYIPVTSDAEYAFIRFSRKGSSLQIGYIDLTTRYLYYSVNWYDLNKVVFESPEELEILSYGTSHAVANYEFYIDDGMPEEGDDVVLDQENKIYSYSSVMRQKQQVRPSDESQEWTDTGVVRDGTNYGESCECSDMYRWLWDSSDYICDGVNKCKRYVRQVRENCGEWTNVKPERYKIGDVLELDSDECGTYEYKEEEDAQPICGSELGDSYNDTTKYLVTRGYIKKKNESDWKMLECEPIAYKVIREKSFDCGWVGYKDGVFRDVCGNYINSLIPNLKTKLKDTTLYNFVSVIDYYKTAPYPINNDELEEDDWIWEVNPKEEYGYTYSISNNNDCGCGYYYTQWFDTDEYACGSELGDTYTPTSQYRKQIKWKVCGGNQLEATDETQWVVYDNKSCECGYRVSGWSIDNTYEYICADSKLTDTEGSTYSSGYTYYKTYYYEQCADGSNRVYNKNRYRYGQASHSTSSVTQCLYDGETGGNTTKRVTKYRTFYNQNTGKYEVMTCYAPTITDTKKSSDCGYKERWQKVDEVCCGYLGEQYEITRVSGLGGDSGQWVETSGVYLPRPITATGRTEILKIYYKTSNDVGIKLNISKNTSSSYLRVYYAFDSDELTNYTTSTGSTYTYTPDDNQEHYISIQAEYRSTSYLNYLPQISVSLYGDCDEFAKYELLELQYSINGGETYIKTNTYKYGSKLTSNDIECGYVPIAEQWVEICPDVTYDDVVVNGVLNDINSCTACFNIEGKINALYSLQKRQESRDLGLTWEDVYPLETRMFRLLRKSTTELGDVCNVADD